mmetsp:Transcript_17598/g.28657  ORF Transcript_17598/g.28657 Transcript_17598/m.28657 type:complete len:232 (+) Transcript_17598:89-784(+)
MEALCPYLWLFQKSNGSTRSHGEDGDDEEALTTAMQKRTRAIHDISDKLVNAKLLMAFSDRKAYGDAVSHFYYIFDAIERQLALNKHENGLKEIAAFLSIMSRAERMKRDLRYFLGADWKPDIKSMPVSVREYVAYIEEVSRERPICLLPYVYHNWMAILAGGQIIRRLATHGMSLPHGKGVSMFAFDGETRASLKRRFKDSVCSIKLDAETRKQVLDESTKVKGGSREVV